MLNKKYTVAVIVTIVAAVLVTRSHSSSREHFIKSVSGLLRVLAWLVLCVAHGALLFTAMSIESEPFSNGRILTSTTGIGI